MIYTLKFRYVSSTERDFVPLLDNGQAITLQVDAPNKSATWSHPDVIAFCQQQGNDCRVTEVI